MSRLFQSHLFLSPRRLLSTSSVRTAFATGPAPPRLPSKEQEEFERLQRRSTGAFSTPHQSVTADETSSTLKAPAQSRPRINQPPSSTSQINQSPPSSQAEKTGSVSAKDIEIETVNARVQATGKGEELHPDVRRGAKPEFEGDVNPKTGEVGGPKNEPLRWGSTSERGDWSYNGRVTDF